MDDVDNGLSNKFHPVSLVQTESFNETAEQVRCLFEAHKEKSERENLRQVFDSSASFSEIENEISSSTIESRK